MFCPQREQHVRVPSPLDPEDVRHDDPAALRARRAGARARRGRPCARAQRVLLAPGVRAPSRTAAAA